MPNENMPNEEIILHLPSGKNAYFASDFHLGSPDYASSREREQRIVAWLSSVENRMGALFLLGDIFDFWFEYKDVVPRGYIRLLGKLAMLSDKGIPIYFFCGNHDMWTSDYLTQEIGLKVYRGPQRVTINQCKFILGHGDGLGPGDHGYKCIKKIFSSPFNRAVFAALHPRWAFALACNSSKKSRNADCLDPNKERKEQIKNENLRIYIRQVLIDENPKYFIFAHRHFPIEEKLGESFYINTGDWLKYNSYVVFDGKKAELTNYLG